MKPRLLLLTSAIVATLAEGAARADDVCLTATVEGQKLQRVGQLVAARERFLACARAECPGDIVSRCERWAQGVVDALPSLVVIVRDGAGHDLSGARVRIDGGAPATRSARAIDLDPGEHRVVVEHDAGPPVEQTVVLHEGEKNRSVVAVFGPAPASAERRQIAERPIPTAAWVAAGIGVLAMASFGAFGISGATDRVSSGCDEGCPEDDKKRVDRQLMFADVSLGVGVVALGIATWLYLARPTVLRNISAADFTLRW